MNDLIELERIVTLLKDDYKKKHSTIKALKELLANNPNLAKDAYKQIKPLLKTNWPKKWGEEVVGVIDALGVILHSDSSFANDLYEQMIPFLKYCSHYATDPAICVLTDIVFYDQSFANKELLNILEKFLADDDIDVTGSANYLSGLINGIIINKHKKK